MICQFWVRKRLVVYFNLKITMKTYKYIPAHVVYLCEFRKHVKMETLTHKLTVYTHIQMTLDESQSSGGKRQIAYISKSQPEFVCFERKVGNHRWNLTFSNRNLTFFKCHLYMFIHLNRLGWPRIQDVKFFISPAEIRKIAAKKRF